MVDIAPPWKPRLGTSTRPRVDHLGRHPVSCPIQTSCYPRCPAGGGGRRAFGRVIGAAEWYPFEQSGIDSTYAVGDASRLLTALKLHRHLRDDMKAALHRTCLKNPARGSHPGSGWDRSGEAYFVVSIIEPCSHIL